MNFEEISLGLRFDNSTHSSPDLRRALAYFVTGFVTDLHNPIERGPSGNKLLPKKGLISSSQASRTLLPPEKSDSNFKVMYWPLAKAKYYSQIYSVRARIKSVCRSVFGIVANTNHARTGDWTCNSNHDPNAHPCKLNNYTTPSFW